LSPIARPGSFPHQITSHSVAVQDGCTNIPLAAGGAQEDEIILEGGFSGHARVRCVHLDPRTDQVLEDSKDSVSAYCLAAFITTTLNATSWPETDS